MMLESVVVRGLVLGLVVILTIVAGRIYRREMRRLRWLSPEPDVRRPAIERLAEAGVLALVSGAVLLATLFRTRVASTPWLWIDPPLYDEFANLALAITAVVTGVLWYGCKGCRIPAFVTIAAGLLMVGNPTFDRSAMLSAPELKSLQRGAAQIDVRVPIVVSCADETIGADIFINGEHIGQTPYETTLGQLRDVAAGTSLPTRMGSNHVGEVFHTPVGKPLWDSAVTWPGQDGPDCGLVSLSLNGEPAKVEATSVPLPKWSTEQRRWLPTAIVILAYFPERERQWNDLLNQIRLRDYHATTPEWLIALESFGMPGQLAFQQALRVEPEFQPIWDAWTKRKYGLQTTLSDDAARQLLERLIAESDNRGQFYSRDGLGMRALEMLIPQLNHQQLTAEVAACLSQHSWFRFDWGNALPFRRPDNFWSYGQFGRDLSGPTEGRTAVVSHAVWALHRSDAGRNYVEQSIVPLLLRHGELETARSLGGPVLRQFMDRHQARLLKDPQWVKRTEQELAQTRGDHWLLSDSGDLAREWRQQNEPLLFHCANRLWLPGPWKIDIIFEDFAGQRDHRVWRFWKYLLAAQGQPIAGQDASRWTHGMLWQFLDRIGPYAPVSAYVDVWNLNSAKNDRSAQLWLLNQDSPNQAPEKRQALYQELAKLVGPPFEDSDQGETRETHYLQNRIAQRIAELVVTSRITREEQAGRLIEPLIEQGHPSHVLANHVQELRKKLRAGELGWSLIRVLAESEIAGARLIGLEFLAEFPRPELRLLLTTLVDDRDADVQRAARKLQSQLQELAHREPIVWKTTKDSSKNKVVLMSRNARASGSVDDAQTARECVLNP